MYADYVMTKFCKEASDDEIVAYFEESGYLSDMASVTSIGGYALLKIRYDSI